MTPPEKARVSPGVYRHGGRGVTGGDEPFPRFWYPGGTLPIRPKQSSEGGEGGAPLQCPATSLTGPYF